MTDLRQSLKLLGLTFLLYSCIAPKSTIYLQDKKLNVKNMKVYTRALTITENYKIQTNDYLYIHVITDNEKVGAYYNLSIGDNLTTTMLQGPNAVKFISYLVDDKGEIDFPSIGKIAVRGLTRQEVKQKLTEILKPQIDNFTLMVELTNAYFTVLGEAHAGSYPMTKDQITVYEALAISGDLTTYSKRKAVRIIRPTINGPSLVKTIDLTDRRLLDSEESYIYPNDIIYVEPIKAKVFGFGESFSLSLATSIISLYLLIRSFN